MANDLIDLHLSLSGGALEALVDALAQAERGYPHEPRHGHYVSLLKAVEAATPYIPKPGDVFVPVRRSRAKSGKGQGFRFPPHRCTAVAPANEYQALTVTGIIAEQGNRVRTSPLPSFSVDLFTFERTDVTAPALPLG